MLNYREMAERCLRASQTEFFLPRKIIVDEHVHQVVGPAQGDDGSP